MGFEQGLSGLEAASQNLSVIGNNVANSSTVGFKSAEALFSDVYANSLSGGGSSQVGIGVKVAGVEQQFTQGNITTSANPLDIAINGDGFYQMSDNGAVSYTRNGQFQLNNQGYIVNAAGDELQGYQANAAGVLQTGSVTSLQINTANISPSSTTKVAAVLNLDAQDTIPTTSPFNPTDPTTYNDSSAVTVYDSLGEANTLQTYYVKTGPTSAAQPGTEGTWAVYGTLNGVPIGYSNTAGATPVPLETLSFSSNGTIDEAATTAASATDPNANSVQSTTNPAQFIITPTITDGATSPLTFTLDFTGTTQYGAPFGTTTLTQNGYTSGELSGFSASANGTIVGTYTNGQTATLGQIALANFADPNGLQSLGNNQWAATATSGQALIGVPGTGQLGVLQSGATEDSNVDLTSQLVNMITAQEAYQANAQTVKTEDTLVQTLITLR
jgi:flagellar hook protein FlgE